MNFFNDEKVNANSAKLFVPIRKTTFILGKVISDSKQF
jgi:hypothetical protein